MIPLGVKTQITLGMKQQQEQYAEQYHLGKLPYFLIQPPLPLVLGLASTDYWTASLLDTAYRYDSTRDVT